jgi:hypothetical protein
MIVRAYVVTGTESAVVRGPSPRPPPRHLPAARVVPEWCGGLY